MVVQTERCEGMCVQVKKIFSETNQTEKVFFLS